MRCFSGVANVHKSILSHNYCVSARGNERKLNFGFMTNEFQDLKVTRQFVDALTDMGVTQPTDIQAKAIVPSYSGQDILGIAQTGSGKTLAYLIPLVMKVKYAQGDHPRALILAPSKELVIQIARVLDDLTKNTDIRSVCLYGGIGKKTQVEEIEKGVDILVSTPGRFLDIYSFGHIYTRQLGTLVLDEADRMMEMGFMPQLRRILEVIPVKRQNLLFSATFPERVEALAAEFLEFPTRVESEDVQKPVKEVVQQWYPVLNFKSKLNLLIHLLEDPEWNRLMVFCRTKDAAERVSKFFDRKDVGEVRVLHSNKGQNSRINALDGFRDGEVRVLVTTDVTSRGIDVEAVSHVVNFEIPKSTEDYLHRIGRTARIHNDGVAVSFVNPSEMPLLDRIEKYIDDHIEKLPWPGGLEEGPYLPGEKKEIDRELDRQKRLADPTFKGAFHEKKRKLKPQGKGQPQGGRSKKSSGRRKRRR